MQSVSLCTTLFVSTCVSLSTCTAMHVHCTEIHHGAQKKCCLFPSHGHNVLWCMKIPLKHFCFVLALMKVWQVGTKKLKLRQEIKNNEMYTRISVTPFRPRHFEGQFGAGA